MSLQLRDLSLDFSQWTLYEVVEPFRILGIPMDGLRQRCYQIEHKGVLVSAGAFDLGNRNTHVAWGIKSQPHCSYHALALPDGSWGGIVEGCPEYRVVRRDGGVVGFCVDGIIVTTGADAGCGNER
jgi:hypothetical protein